jgi:CheY-like chemotaxis protein/DNA-directed RNA polymerase subunit F
VSYKILLADDSVTVQKIITLTFSDEGVDVMSVNNGDEAIQRLQYMRPALVMADVSIPGKSGYEICEYVKSHPEMRNTPVILLVPAFEPFDEERARRIGADHHLTKPFQSIRTLISTVKNLIEPDAPVPSPPPVPQDDALGTAPFDPKSARIEELIRKSHTAAVEREDELLTDIGPEKSGFVQASMAANQYEVTHKYEPAPLAASENHVVKMPTESIAIEDASNEFDDILELGDVLPELAPAAAAPIETVMPALPPMEAREIQDEEMEEVTISPSVVDEIVNRVVARLSTQLVSQLSSQLGSQFASQFASQVASQLEGLEERLMERIAGELARRTAPEVVEIVPQQQLADPGARRGTDNLLEID